jgi:hypothetical protein
MADLHGGAMACSESEKNVPCCRFLFACASSSFVVSDGFHLLALCRSLSFFVAGAVCRQLIELHQHLVELSLSSSPL